MKWAALRVGLLIVAAGACARHESPIQPFCEGRMAMVVATLTVTEGATVQAQAMGTGCVGSRGVTWRTADSTVAAIVEAHDSAGVSVATIVGRRAGSTRVIATSVADPVRAAAADVAVLPLYAFPITQFEIHGAIDVSGRVLVRGDTLRGTLLLSNAGKDTAWVEYGACSVGIRAYTSAARAEPTPWLMTLPPNSACILVGYRMWLPGGATDSIVTVARQGQTMPKLPTGHYWFALVVGGPRWVPAGEGDVP